MHIRPVRSYGSPAYPHRHLAVQNPDLLSRHIPAAWVRSEIVAGALAVFVLGGCVKTVDGERGKADGSKVIQDVRHDKESTRGIQRGAARVAPVFIHGSGAGATGCEVIAPPVFLSESEAREIIEKEFSTVGLYFDKHGVKVDGVELDTVKEELDEKHDLKTRTVGTAPFLIDAMNEKARIGYEFVSADDYYKSRTRDFFISVQHYAPKEAAEHVREKLATNGGFAAAVFYDPVTKYDPHMEKEQVAKLLNEEPVELGASEKEAKEISVRLLRAQVRDFIAWAKAEGVLK